jgi:hypothetical protein
VSLADRIIYQAPTEAQISVKREPVPGAVCPQCGGEDVRRYPIAWSRGPRIVTKCQTCFSALAVDRPAPEDAWPPFRAVAYDWEVSAAERPSIVGRA